MKDRMKERISDLRSMIKHAGKWPLMLPHEAWILEFTLAHGCQLARRLSKKLSGGEAIPVPEEPTALHLLILDSWIPQGLEHILDSLWHDRTAHN